MADQPTAEDIPASDFPNRDPLFANATPEEVVQWTWIIEDLESDEDDRLLDELGITGEMREKLRIHMVASRLAFKSMISAGVGFSDPDYRKSIRMIELAHSLVEASNTDPQPDTEA